MSLSRSAPASEWPRQDRPRGWAWVPKNAANKDAAWTVITYLCSREWGKFEVAANQTDPTRNSVFFDPALNSKFPI